MTAQEMIEGLYEELGNLSNLDPYTAGVFDITTSGAVKILGFINRAYKRIFAWKFPDGRLIRFRNSTQSAFFKMPLVEGTATAGSATTITLAAGSSTVDDFYNGWTIEIDGGTGDNQRRLIVDYVGSTLVATVHKDFDTTPDTSSTYDIYKNFMEFVDSAAASASVNIPLDLVSDVLAPVKVVALEEERDLIRGDRTDNWVTNIADYGDPTTYVWEENGRLIFNYGDKEQRWYKVEYIGYPASLTAATDEPAIPEPFHEAIYTYALHLGMRRYQDYSAAYVAKRDTVDLMSSLKEQIESSHEREETRFTMDRGY